VVFDSSPRPVGSGARRRSLRVPTPGEAVSPTETARKTAEQTITSPVTGEAIGVFRETPASEVDDLAVALARRFTARERARLARTRVERCAQLNAVANWLEHDIDRVAAEMVVEHGKPTAEARDEVASTADQIRQTAAFARAYGPTVPPAADPAKRILISVEPLGVIAAITPWNFPLYVPVEYLVPALAMGNAVLWKPAESTPLSNANLLAAFRAGGFDESTLVMLVGGPATGRALVDATAVSALGFTGSSVVGDEIGSRFSGRPLLTELGGNGPTIVFADADIEAAAAAIATATFCTSGQSCSSTERVLVEADIAEAFADALVVVARTYVIGDPRDPGTAVGPLHLAETVEKVRDHVEDAIARGATVRCGGTPASGYPTDRYWPPTVLTNVPPAATIFQEETFGPVAPITLFTDEPEALALAEIGRWGLSAAVFSRDLARAHRVADGLSHGIVSINGHSDYWEPQLPVGGGPGTRSGRGRLGIENMLRFASTTKVIAVHAP
jgi:acyl-CoA reductase-like NAD-dependent aldehyde dehydrogenase